MPIALPRSSGAKVLITIAPDGGTISAAPIPCIARAARIAVSDCANPQAAEAATKIAAPSMNIRACPNISPSLPPMRDERGQREQVGVDDPLQPRLRDVEIALDRRQRHPDHGLVDEDHRQTPGHRDRGSTTCAPRAGNLAGLEDDR